MTRNVQTNFGIWIVDLLRGGTGPFTFEPETEGHPIWSPDGLNIVYESSRHDWKMRMKPAGGVGTDELLFDEPDLQRPQDWSRDGRFLVSDKLTSQTGHDVWILEMTGDRRKATPFVVTPAEELNAQLLPAAAGSRTKPTNRANLDCRSILSDEDTDVARFHQRWGAAPLEQRRQRIVFHRARPKDDGSDDHRLGFNIRSRQARRALLDTHREQPPDQFPRPIRRFK